MIYSVNRINTMGPLIGHNVNYINIKHNINRIQTME